ncbi:MAG: hypothetical protein K2L49_08525 [Muribaculaceae bacterium]|nr:hypothetical protein [Muribaculaceae bacterium]
MKKNVFYYCLLGAIAAAGASCSSDDEVLDETPITPPVVEETGNYFEEPANTYIVSEEGEYSFDTRKPNGDLIPDIESAGWIWATKIEETDTEQQLISDVRYEDGKIYFNATGKRGNAVIAAFNASLKPMWVWLIWCTDQPETMEFENGVEFLDREIGATSATPGDKNTRGLIVYQHGRIVPIFGGYEDEMHEDQNVYTFYEAEKWTIMNPEYGYKWEVSRDQVTVEESIEYPTTLFGNATWTPSFDPSIWDRPKNIYDPSPAGYQISSADDWGDVIDERKIEYDENLQGGIYTYNGKSAWFPTGNMGRHYTDGSYMEGQAMQGLTYWNGPAYIDDMPWYPAPRYYASRACIYFNTSFAGNSCNNMANSGFAFAIRCVRIQD